jgi:hypothetical protein
VIIGVPIARINRSLWLGIRGIKLLPMKKNTSDVITIAFAGFTPITCGIVFRLAESMRISRISKANAIAKR